MPGLQRRLTDLASAEALRHLRYVPRVIRRVKNWPRFLLAYARVDDRATVFELRSGLRIRTRSGVDASTIAVVFIKDDYGTGVASGTVIDVGANIGAFALLAATTGARRVIAYEPVSTTCEQLQTNVALNGLTDRITVHNAGVAARREERTIAISRHGSPFATLYSAGGPHETISCVSLDDAFAENDVGHCDILKLDCEGAEFEILYEASDQVLRRITRIYLEFHERPGGDELSGAALVQFLAKHGFALETPFDQTAVTGTIRLVRRNGSPS